MKKNQPKINTFKRSFLRKTALFVAASTLFSTPFIFAPFYAGLKWQKLSLPFPDMPILQKDGTELRLKQFFGKPVLINFWATWCAPCIVELPYFQKAASMQDQLQVEILLVSTDRINSGEVNKFLDEKQIYTPKRGFDPKAIWARSLNISALPATLLINAEQTAGLVHTGIADWSSSDVRDDLIMQLKTMG